MAGNELKQVLLQGARELGLVLSDEQARQCLLYLEELKKWNRKINLTAITGDRDIIVKHFIDSFSYIKGFVPGADISLLDMGSGAGFPAIPIKIAFPGITVALVESVGKKAAFLRHIIRTVKLSGAEVRDVRTGDLPVEFDRSVDVVTARAFASMERALAEGARFLKPGGVMVLSRGPEESIDDSVVAAAGMVTESRIDMVLPLSDHRRTLWMFRKK